MNMKCDRLMNILHQKSATGGVDQTAASEASRMKLLTLSISVRMYVSEGT
jgi:hypothetical protein